MSSEEFLALCRVHLNDEHFEALAGAQPGGSCRRRWEAFDHSLRRSLARLRSRRLDWAGDQLDISDTGPVDEAAVEAFEEENPLEAESILFKARWRFLDELERETFMTFQNLTVYLLKLQLMEANSAFSKENGHQALIDLRRAAATETPPTIQA